MIDNKRKWIISDPIFESDVENNMLSVSPWSGHRNFVYDYIREIQPQRIVELGTHYACSFFAMAQSVKDNNLQTELYAVDTWEGDPQAGFYGNDVWEKVNETKDKHFSQINIHLERMLFDRALLLFENETFDLIHIDGLHTYEAVKHDFESWLPKLKKDGVVLFHDVHSEKGYGSDNYWKEIKKRYDYWFEFSHSWGLGILFPKGNSIYKYMLDQNFSDKVLIYQYKALNALKARQVSDLTAMANERYEAINKQSKMIDDRNAEISALTALVKEKDEGLNCQTKLIDERDATIKSQGEIILEKDEAIRSQTKLIDERDETIKALEKLVQEKDEGLDSQTKLIEERDASIKAQENLIKEKDETIRSQTKLIDERDETIRAQEKLVQEKDEGLQNQTKLIDERDATIKAQEELIKEKDEAIRSQTKLIDERDETIKTQELALEDIKEELRAVLSKVNKHKLVSKIIMR